MIMGISVDAVVDNGDKPAVSGRYGATKGEMQYIDITNAKSVELLRMEYNTMQIMTRDTMAYFQGFTSA